MDADTYPHGVPSWLDLSTPDIAAAATFYGALFGWDCPEGSPETGGYRDCTLRGRAVAGIGPQMAPGVPPMWTSYVNVDDADALAALVTANGGTVVVPPMDVMAFGRMAVFADPGGAMFSVWQPGTHTGAKVVHEHGAYTWRELLTDDTGGAIDFYGAVFGWSAATSGDQPYTMFSLHDHPVAGMMARPDTMPAEVPPLWTVYFHVDDPDATCARIIELGGTVEVPPFDLPSGRMAVVSDPTGAVFQVMHMAVSTTA